MAVMSEFLSRIFLSLEIFFQKTKTLDVFEDFMFSYKIKLDSAEKCSSQFLIYLVQFEEEIQWVIKELTSLPKSNQWKLFPVSSYIPIGDNVERSDEIADMSHSALSCDVVYPHGKHSTEITVLDVTHKKVESSKLEQSKSEVVFMNPICKSSDCLINNSPSASENNVNSIQTCNAVNNKSNIFKCNHCLRKFRTSLKLKKHSCRKLINNKSSPDDQLISALTNCNANNEDIHNEESNVASVDEERIIINYEPPLGTSENDQQSLPIIESTRRTTSLQLQQSHEGDDTLRSDMNLPVYSCSLCCVAFLERSRWDDHVCKEKDGGVSGKRELVASRSLLKERRWFVCGSCSEPYRSLGRIMYHLVRCSTGPYPCEICSNMFTTRSQLNYHKKKQHKGVESFFCNECGLGFKLRTSLQKHLIKRHENLQGEYHCDFTGCQLVFPKKIFLTHHKINDHRMERKYLCQICGNKFYNRCSLSSHIDTHSEKKRFLCPVCCRVLKTKEKLTLHIRTHTGERPFTCTICGKSFIAKSKLEEHARRHRGEKRHKCKDCGKLYANGFDLKQHVKKCNPNRNDEHKNQKQQPVNMTAMETNKEVDTTSSTITVVQHVKNKNLIKQPTTNNSLNRQVQNQNGSINKKDTDFVNTNILPTQPLAQSNSNVNISSSVSLTSPSGSSNTSNVILQLDNTGRVIPVQTTALHVVDYVPFYPSSEPVHIVMPPQTLVLTGYENLTY